MKLEELKRRIEKPSLFPSLMNLAKDPTLENTRKDQIEGLLFSIISGGEVWDECDNNKEI